MKTRANQLLSWAAAALIAVTGTLGAQSVSRSEPANGATDVCPDVGEIRVHFDSDMLTDSFTVVDAPDGKFPPPAGDNRRPWRSAHLFAIRIGKLEPNTTYALQLNSSSRRGFQTAARRPLPVTVIRFTTGSGGEVTMEDARRVLMGGRDDNGRSTTVSGILTPQVGWRFKVNRGTFVKLQASQGQKTVTMAALAKAKFVEEVNQVSGGRPSEVTRQVEELTLQQNSSEAQGPQKKELCPAGSSFRVAFVNGRGRVTGSASNAEVNDALSSPITPAILPEGTLTAGRRWSFRDQQITDRLWFMEARGGRLDLQVVRIDADEETGLPMAEIEGKLVTKIQLDEMLLDFRAEVKMVVPVAIGVPLVFQVKGKFSAESQGQDAWGQPVRCTIAGEGEFHQSAIPMIGIIKAAREASGLGGGASTGGVIANTKQPAADYGYAASDYISINGYHQVQAYLKSLVDAEGRPFQFRRVCSIAGRTDLYRLAGRDGKEFDLYINQYGSKSAAETPAPRGLGKRS